MRIPPGPRGIVRSSSVVVKPRTADEGSGTVVDGSSGSLIRDFEAQVSKSIPLTIRILEATNRERAVTSSDSVSTLRQDRCPSEVWSPAVARHSPGILEVDALLYLDDKSACSALPSVGGMFHVELYTGLVSGILVGAVAAMRPIIRSVNEGWREGNNYRSTTRMILIGRVAYLYSTT